MGRGLPAPGVIMHFGKECGNVGNPQLADTPLGFSRARCCILFCCTVSTCHSPEGFHHKPGTPLSVPAARALGGSIAKVSLTP